MVEDLGSVRRARIAVERVKNGVERDPRVLVDAWDEGYEAGVEDAVSRSSPPGPNGPSDPTRNPYKEAGVDG